MKERILVGAAALMLGSAASAQSSVTLYGVIDAGITFVNNANQSGEKLWQTQSGIAQGSRFGMKGTEDLGGGLSALFQLENGFDVFSGRLAQGGLLFGRQAYVGLSDTKLGTLTLGRQYDSIVDYLQVTTFNGNYGAYFSHAGDIDNSDNGFRVNNAVKYTSPSIAGLTVGGMYALGGVAGQFGRNSTIATGLSYQNGPIYAAAAYMYAKNPATQFQDGNFVPNGANGAPTANGPFGYVGIPANEQVFGLGVTWQASNWLLGANFTDARFDSANGTNRRVRFDTAEGWASYTVNAATTLAAGYQYTWAKVDYNDSRPHYHQVNAMADYHLSKRTDVYVMGVFEKAGGGAKASIYNGLLGSEASGTTQVAARVGIRHRF